MLCFVVVMQSFIMNSHEVFIHIHQGCFAGAGAIVRLPQCQWSKHDGYGKISQCITTTKHSKVKTVCIFLGIYCSLRTLRPKQNGGHSDDFLKCFFLNENVCFCFPIKIRLGFVIQWLIDKKSALTWCEKGDKPLPKPMTSRCTNAYMHHPASMG